MNLSSRIVLAIACVFTGLLVLVIVVGLLRDQVDTNGLALILTPIISGLLLGGGLRSANNKTKEEEPPPPPSSQPEEKVGGAE